MISSQSVYSQSILEQAITNTDTLELNISLTEERIKEIRGNSLQDVARRSNLSNELLRLKQEKGRRLLLMAIEDTDVSRMDIESAEISKRFRRRTVDFGTHLNVLMGNTIIQANPAIAGVQKISGRPLVLYRDVDPSDVFMAKDPMRGEFVVYRTKDLRGRSVYKDLSGNVSEAVIQRRIFPKEEVVIMDEKGNLLKGTPKAIFEDGTLEIRDSSGLTQRRRAGAYHLTDEIESVQGNKIIMRSGRTESNLTDKEKKALAALKKAMCGL